MAADRADMAERIGRLGRVFEQRRLEIRVDPGAGDKAGAVFRADLGLVAFNQEVECCRIDIALLGEDGFERAHAKLNVGQLGMPLVGMPLVRMVVVMVVIGHRQTSALCIGRNRVAQRQARFQCPGCCVGVTGDRSFANPEGGKKCRLRSVHSPRSSLAR
jgi:hypothetical protein